MVQCHFGVIWCTCLKWTVTGKRLVVEQNGVKFGTVVTHIWGAFDVVGFKVILESFGALFSKRLVTQKTAGHGAKRTEIYDPRTLVTHIWCTSYLEVFSVILRCICPKMA